MSTPNVHEIAREALEAVKAVATAHGVEEEDLQVILNVCVLVKGGRPAATMSAGYADETELVAGMAEHLATTLQVTGASLPAPPARGLGRLG